MPEFRRYNSSDREACLAIFDSNCPEFLHPKERADFQAWLDAPEGIYLVMVESGRVIGCGGFVIDAQERKLSLCWGLLHADWHGRRLGELLLLERLTRGVDSGGATWSRLATTPKVEPFFVRVGYRRVEHTPDGWGPGMDSVELRLELGPEVVEEFKERRRRFKGPE